MSKFGEAWERDRAGLNESPKERLPGQPPPPKKRLSLEEITDLLSQLAQDPEAGADRFRALKMLANTEATAIALPQPMHDGEVLERLARVMKGAGVKLCQLAYVKAFPHVRGANIAGGQMRYTDASPQMIEASKKITSLKVLYRQFPETWRRGVPKGFPSGRSSAVKMEWCQNEALRILVERETRDRKAAHVDMQSTDREIREATDGPSAA